MAISRYNCYAAPCMCWCIPQWWVVVSVCCLCITMTVSLFFGKSTASLLGKTLPWATAHCLWFIIFDRHSWKMTLNVDLNHWYLLFSFKTRFRAFPRANQETCAWNRPAPNSPATLSRNLPTHLLGYLLFINVGADARSSSKYDMMHRTPFGRFWVFLAL